MYRKGERKVPFCTGKKRIHVRLLANEKSYVQLVVSLRLRHANVPRLYYHAKRIGLEAPWEFTAYNFHTWIRFTLLHRVHMYIFHLTAHSRTTQCADGYLLPSKENAEAVYCLFPNSTRVPRQKKGGGMVSFRRTAVFVSELLPWPSGVPPPRVQFH